jgi:uncharacterized membrane protein (UPF0182 family)
LGEALNALFTDEAIIVEEPVATPTGEEPVEPTPEPVTVVSEIDLETATVAELAQAADAHFEAAQQAQQAGDWATYGEELAQLELVLNRLVELAGSGE